MHLDMDLGKELEQRMALLELNTSVGVMPACVDWYGETHVGHSGTVVARTSQVSFRGAVMIHLRQIT